MLVECEGRKSLALRNFEYLSGPKKLRIFDTINFLFNKADIFFHQDHLIFSQWKLTFKCMYWSLDRVRCSIPLEKMYL